MPNRLTFGSEKDKLRMVVDNGVDASDPRVLTRTNEAIQLGLKMRDPQTNEPIIPVGTMMTAIVQVTNDIFYLPPEMDSAYHLEPDAGQLGTANDSENVQQGFYDILNPFTYLNPSMAHDNPFEDLYLTNELDATKYQRKYRYRGAGTTRILVIGPKAYVPITQDSDPLLIQNVPVLKTIIQAQEYKENNQVDEGRKLMAEAVEILLGEIKAHNMDPRWIMKRKADYEREVTTYAIGSKGWMRARIALEVPNAMSVGKEEIGRVLDRGQLRMMEAGAFRGCIQEFNATITDGHVHFPRQVESVLAASLEGEPLDIRSLFYKYLNNGGSWDCGCDGRLDDEGETFFPNSGQWRRTYRAYIGTDGSEITAACKLRWEPKKANEQMVIKNFEANRVMASAILLEGQDKWNEAAAARELVLGKDGILQMELEQYLAGIKHTLPSSVGGGLAGMSACDLGEML